MTVLNYKCPCCGYIKQTAKTFNPSRKIAELKRRRSKSVRKASRDVVNKITTHIPSDNQLIKEYYFYQSISKVDGRIVKWGIERYVEASGYLKGKGFKYLTQIILNHNSNRESMKKYERKMIGKPPSIVKLKKED